MSWSVLEFAGQAAAPPPTLPVHQLLNDDMISVGVRRQSRTPPPPHVLPVHQLLNDDMVSVGVRRTAAPPTLPWHLWMMTWSVWEFAGKAAAPPTLPHHRFLGAGFAGKAAAPRHLGLAAGSEREFAGKAAAPPTVPVFCWLRNSGITSCRVVDTRRHKL